ncbi:MAG TPA: T9SS type A sorting domain-containing protein, partial [Anaerolineae bacterium]|nr:T9SS type A sorting domain-containing protein [Anaerolineae bacterium]
DISNDVFTITRSITVDHEIPFEFSATQNTPNPFNPVTTISFSLAEAGNTTVEIYNVRGQKVDTLVNGYLEAGWHSMVWDGSGFAAGVYFYTVTAGGFSKVRKMMLVK